MQDPLEYAKQIAYSSEEVLRFTYEKAKEYANKPGVYVECGVAAGAQIIAMAAGAPNKTIYAFDSFEGIPLPSNKDDQYPGVKFLSKEEQSKLPNPGEQVLESSGATSVTLHSFYSHLAKAFGHGIVLYGFDVPYAGEETKNVIPVKGWFEETLPTFECEPISLLRLDGDLYNSTYVCLKYLYPKVIEGGLIVIDDYALPGCKQAVFDYFYGLPEYQSFNSKSLADFAIETRVQFIKDENSTVAYWIK